MARERLDGQAPDGRPAPPPLVRRFDLIPASAICDGLAMMSPADDGDWVPYDDIAYLLQERRPAWARKELEMPTSNVGSRVGAILSCDSAEVHLLGFGVYDGDHEPPFGLVPMSEIDAMKERGELPRDWAWKNPRITLDDGRVVWGCQCWWGPEEVIRQCIAGLKIIPATV